MPETAQEWTVPVPPGIQYPSLSLDLGNNEKLMHLVSTKAELLQLAENILDAAENQ
jgi:hypothetical protein